MTAAPPPQLTGYAPPSRRALIAEAGRETAGFLLILAGLFAGMLFIALDMGGAAFANDADEPAVTQVVSPSGLTNSAVDAARK